METRDVRQASQVGPCGPISRIISKKKVPKKANKTPNTTIRTMIRMPCTMK